MRGWSIGLQATGTGCPPNDQLLRQGIAGLNGCPQDSDEFGFSLSAGRLNEDGAADLAIGVPGQGFGAVHIIYGVDLVGCVAGDGLDASPPASSGVPRDSVMGQNSACVENAAESGDRFGERLD